MTVALRDYPDWNPPRDQLAARAVGPFTISVADGDVSQIAIDASQLDNVVLITTSLIAGTGLSVGADTLAGGAASPRALFDQGTDNLYIELPTLHRGSGLTVEAFNFAGAPFDFVLDLVSFTGVSPELIVPAVADVLHDSIVIPGSGSSAVVDLPQFPFYQRATLSVSADVACDVFVQRAMRAPGSPYALHVFSQQVATLTGSNAATVDVPIGAPGFAVVFTNAGAGAGHGAVMARGYRPDGF